MQRLDNIYFKDINFRQRCLQDRITLYTNRVITFCNLKGINSHNIILFSLHTDFITWRGHLTKIMCTPYETREPWQMAATLYNGTIYISEIETEENREKRKNMEEKHKEMCYWGYNFESYVTSHVDKNRQCKNGASKTESRACNDSEAFITVIRTRLGKHSLVFGAEVDCCTKVCSL